MCLACEAQAMAMQFPIVPNPRFQVHVPDNVVQTQASGDPSIDGLLWGWHFGTTDWGYSFPASPDEYFNPQPTAFNPNPYLGAGYERIEGFDQFDATQQAQTVGAVDNVQNFLPVTFRPNAELGANATVVFRFAEAQRIDTAFTPTAVNQPVDLKLPGHRQFGSAEAAVPDPFQSNWRAAGDTWYIVDRYENPIPGTFNLAAGVLHEFGHALGLKHGHHTQPVYNVDQSSVFRDFRGNAFAAPLQVATAPKLPDAEDSQNYSIMTYRVYEGDDPNDNNQPTDISFNEIVYPWTFMQNDIAALQYIYGANFGDNSNPGNTVYTVSAATGQMTVSDSVEGSETSVAPKDGKVFLTIWDGGGFDTYNFQNFSGDMVLNLAPGAFSTFSRSHLAPLGASIFAEGNIANARQFQGDPRSLIEGAVAGAGNDLIVGNAAGNLLRGRAGSDRLFGGVGDDTLEGGLGVDTLNGGAGVDTASYGDATAAVGARLDGVASFGQAAGDVFQSIESLAGSRFDDALVGSNGGNVLSGGDGADRLFGLAGRDRLFGGDGNDILDGGLGGDFIDGGPGVDIATYASATAAVGARLDGGVNFGQAADEILRNVEIVVGSRFDDALVGSDGGDRLSGGGGSDRLFGLAGRDQLFGDAGNDTLDGGLGADLIDGGAGFDTAAYASATAAVGVRLDGGVNFGQAAGEILRGVEALTGSRFNDALVGSAGGNVLEGLDGADRLFGQGGRDQLFGGGGADRLAGGEGDDFLSGGPGNDRLIGGLGADAFHFGAAGFGDDVIEGFQDGLDRFDFRGFADRAPFRFAESAAGVRIDVGEDSIFVLGVARAALTVDDFLLG